MKMKATTAVTFCLGLMLLVAGPAMGQFGIESFDSSLTTADGRTATQAGSHPFAFTTTFRLTTRDDGGAVSIDGSPKRITAELPPGLVGNPTAIPRCTSVQIDSDLGGNGCPTNTQVGIITVTVSLGGSVFDLPHSLFNMEPPDGMPAQFAFNLLGQIVHLNASVRAGGDYGLDTSLIDVSQGLAVVGSKVELWGVPSDPAHDGVRWCPTGNPCSTNAPQRPFLTLPTSCAGPQTNRLSIVSWQQPDRIFSASSVSHDLDGAPVGNARCERVPFSPSVSVTPTTSVTGAATGLAVEVKVPQNESPTGIAPRTCARRS